MSGMDQILRNLRRTDLQTSLLCLAILFAGEFFFPDWRLWFVLIPLTVFYCRMNVVLMRRERELLMHQGRGSAPGGDGGQSRIGIPDRAE